MRSTALPSSTLRMLCTAGPPQLGGGADRGGRLHRCQHPAGGRRQAAAPLRHPVGHRCGPASRGFRPALSTLSTAPRCGSALLFLLFLVCVVIGLSRGARPRHILKMLVTQDLLHVTAEESEVGDSAAEALLAGLDDEVGSVGSQDTTDTDSDTEAAIEEVHPHHAPCSHLPAVSAQPSSPVASDLLNISLLWHDGSEIAICNDLPSGEAGIHALLCRWQQRHRRLETPAIAPSRLSTKSGAIQCALSAKLAAALTVAT